MRNEWVDGTWMARDYSHEQILESLLGFPDIFEGRKFQRSGDTVIATVKEPYGLFLWFLD